MVATCDPLPGELKQVSRQAEGSGRNIPVGIEAGMQISKQTEVLN